MSCVQRCRVCGARTDDGTICAACVHAQTPSALLTPLEPDRTEEEEPDAE